MSRRQRLVACGALCLIAAAGVRAARIDGPASVPKADVSAEARRAAAAGRMPKAEPAQPDRTPWLLDQIAAAPAGALITVPAGLYHGPFVIARPVHLRGQPGAHLHGDGTTHTVSVQAPDVTIEGFEISGSGLDLTRDHAAIHITGVRAAIVGNRIHHSLHGVYVRQADGARIEGNAILGTETTLEAVDPNASAGRPSEGELCEVDLNQNQRGNGIHIWNSSHHLVTRNVIRHTRDGVYFSFVDRTEVRDNDIEGVRYGLHYMYSDDNHFEGNVFRDNAAGAAIMSSKNIVLRRNQFLANRSHRAYGILLQTVDNTTLEANRIAGNTIGVFFESGHGNRVIDNVIAHNHIGIHASDSSDGNQFTGNDLIENLHTVETTGGNLTSVWAVGGRGNHWSGAVTIDLDRDGIADLPHRELDLFGQTRRNLPVIGLLAGSPGERLLRFVHARIALPGLPGVTDPAPLVRPAQP
jgi:nitrous oxidase accessory protein